MMYVTVPQILKSSPSVTLKHFVEEDGIGWLVPDNPDYPKFRVTEGDDFSIWGTVTYIIHKARD